MLIFKSVSDMEKRPSSLAVLAEIFLALAEILQQDTIFYKTIGHWWKAEEIKTE